MKLLPIRPHSTMEAIRRKTAFVLVTLTPLGNCNSGTSMPHGVLALPFETCTLTPANVAAASIFAVDTESFSAVNVSGPNMVLIDSVLGTILRGANYDQNL